MGSASRVKPQKLAEKLSSIRSYLKLNQVELAEKLSHGRLQLRKSDISRYESGLREPALIVLLRYARLGNVSIEILADDEQELPENFRSA